jgi:hypothetical protein
LKTAAVVRGAVLELEHEFRVRDVHARLSTDGADVEGPAVGPEQLERELRQAGITRAVVFSAAGGDRTRANNAVARMSTGRPFVPFARIGGPEGSTDRLLDRVRTRLGGRAGADDAEPESPATVRRYATDDRFHGFVVDPVRDGVPAPAVRDALGEAGRPVLVRAGAEFPPAAAEPLLEQPTPVVLAHFGGYPLRRDLMREAIELLGAHENCYLDTSHVRYRDLLARALREHPDRVLFGSGTPTVHPSVAVAEHLSVDVPADGVRKAFERNPGRLVEGL